MKTDPDVKRFLRYQSAINVLYVRDSFHKSEIYEALKNEKPQFIGHVIGELVRDGYLTNSGSKTEPRYSWSAKKEEFNPRRWIDQRGKDQEVIYRQSPYKGWLGSNCPLSPRHEV